MPYSNVWIAPDVDAAANLLAELEGMLTAHSAWTFVEEVSGYRVWRNDGNDFGADFHVGISATAVVGSLSFVAFENWDVSTKAISRPCTRSSTVKPCGADGSLNDGAAYTSGAFFFGGGSLFRRGLWGPSATVGVESWFSVTANRIIGFTRRDSDAAVTSIYVGHFESFIPDHPNENPLVIVDPVVTATTVTTYTIGAWSRHPGREGTSDRENFAIYPMIAGAASDWTKTYGSVGTPGAGDLFHGGKPVGSRLLCRTIGAAATYGYLRGLYFNILDIPVSGAVAAGDTIVVDGDTWVYMGHNGNWMNASV